MYKALIIDDEKPVRTVISALGKWSTFGIDSPYTAGNGQDGLNTMRELRPDIVFVDMEMPVMNGIDFLKKATKEFNTTKFIVVSGYDDFKYTQAAIQNGAIDYLLKPIVVDELNNSIKKAMSLVSPSLENNNSNNTLSADYVVDIIKDYIEKNYCSDIKISMFSEKYFFSKEYLSKMFKKKYNCGIYEYAMKLRMNRAKLLLKDNSISIKEISDRLGFSNNNYFSKAFKNYTNLSPTEFKENSKKEVN